MPVKYVLKIQRIQSFQVRNGKVKPDDVFNVFEHPVDFKEVPKIIERVLGTEVKEEEPV